MEYEYQVTVLTPAYNRAKLVKRLYKSLIAQTDENFQWLIIDDGSTDSTEKEISKFSGHKFQLDYYKKKNGGKHTALNFSHPYIKGKYTIIVDSDDWLLPDAISTIKKYWTKYSKYQNVKVIVFQKGEETIKGIVPLTNIPDKPFITNPTAFQANGDSAEVIDSDVFKTVVFPVFEGEKFLGEGYLWNNVGYLYDYLYIKKVIYVCEYLEDGLTKSGRILRLKCPNGGMVNSNSFFGGEKGRKMNKRTLRKEAWLFVCYGKFAGLKKAEIISRCDNHSIVKKNYFFGILLYKYWKVKYKL